MKRVLLISYYFPPSGGSGVQRVLKFVKYLPDYGWEATILTVDPKYAAYWDLDPTMQVDIPEKTRIIRTSALDPYGTYSRFVGRKKNDSAGIRFVDSREIGFREKVARWVRSNIFLPDARVGWVPFAVKAARKELAARSYEAIITTGPPHSTHLIGQRIRRSVDIPWVVDLRDAWPSDSYAHLVPTMTFAEKFDHRRRSGIFKSANRITTVSKVIAEDAARLTETPVRIVANGFDESDFEDSSLLSSNHFTIVYTGQMSDERNPESLWKAIKRKTERGEWGELRVHLVGNISDEVQRSINHLDLGSLVTLTPYVSHSEAIRWMCGASLLLLIINLVPNPDGIVTGKLYEYLASGRPILCIGPENGDAAEIIRTSSAGKTLEHENCDGIEDMIEEAYENWRKGQPVDGAESSVALQYSRRIQTGLLAGILDEISG